MGRELRAAMVTAGLLAGTEAVRRLVGPPLADLVLALHPPARPLELPLPRLVLAGCAGALAVAWGRLLLVALLTTFDAVRHPDLPPRHGHGCSGAVRVAVLVLLGVSASAAPALADDGSGTGRAGITGLPLPDRVGTARVSADPARRVVPVLPGDSLWSITARLLGPQASPADIERGWRALAEANRDRLGPDPDLIFPGTALRVPDLPLLGKEQS